jgi:hypothetical protein
MGTRYLMGAFAWDAWGTGGGGERGSLAKPKIIVMKIGDT